MDAKYLEEIKARCNEGRPTARIDVKALISEVERLTEENANLEKANAEWDIIHTADAVSVVRCRNCKYWRGGYCGFHSDIMGPREPMCMDANDFCSYGERKDGEK